MSGNYPDVELTFFASRSDGLRALRLSERSLVSDDQGIARNIQYTSGGKASVEIDHYDIFLVYGLGLGIPRLDRRLSSEVLMTVCRRLLNNSLNYSVGSLVRSVISAPIFLGHNPQPAYVEGSRDNPNALNYDEVHRLLLSVIKVEGVVLVSQPTETFIDDFYTRPELSKGSTRLDLGDLRSNEVHPDYEVGHMNERFGSIYLEKFLNIVSAPTNHCTT
jgi:hypothetical protein